LSLALRGDRPAPIQPGAVGGVPGWLWRAGTGGGVPGAGRCVHLAVRAPPLRPKPMVVRGFSRLSRRARDFRAAANGRILCHAPYRRGFPHSRRVLGVVVAPGRLTGTALAGAGRGVAVDCRPGDLRVPQAEGGESCPVVLPCLVPDRSLAAPAAARER